MKNILSFSERYSFTKIFSISLIFATLLTGFAYAQEDMSVVTLDVFSQNSVEEINTSAFPPKTITLVYGDTEIFLLTYDEYVSDVLNTHEIPYSQDDIIFPSLDFEIRNTNYIKIILVNKELRVVIEDIPFETEIITDKNLSAGTEVIEQEGSMGKVEVTYADIFKNGEHVTTEVYSSEVIENSVNNITRVGSQTSAIGGRNCPHWFNIVDQNTANDDEREILKSLISCESKCNDSKSNNNTYLGLLQFSKNTFFRYGGEDIWSGEQQIIAAINILRAGGLSHHWPACSRKIN